MPDETSLFLGLDAGTSGIRATCVDGGGRNVASASIRFDDDAQARDPQAWKTCLTRVLEKLSHEVSIARIAGIAVDGQSGTVLLCDNNGLPIVPPKFYYQTPSTEAVDLLADVMLREGQDVPATLGRVLDLWSEKRPKDFRIVHQADWIAGLFCGRFDFSDENNSLKLGYDPSTRAWSFDANALPFDKQALPTVHPPATAVGPVSAAIVSAFGLSPVCQVYSGTTDGTAGFIAASGLDDLTAGTAVTTLGTTLVIKTISPVRVDVSGFGIYSHRLFDNWIAGGASNSGGGALLRHFSPDEMTALSEQIDPGVPSKLDYYPLVSSGERFPIADPQMKDRTEPRPDDPADFLAGLFESIARIEKRGFDLLQAHGVPKPAMVKTVGGGSRNQVWLDIRARVLGCPVIAACETEAAYGSALIALHGAQTR